MNSSKAVPNEGYNASGSQTTSVIEFTIVGVTIVPEQGFMTVKVKLEGVASEVLP
jgi:hypothetical protein